MIFSAVLLTACAGAPSSVSDRTYSGTVETSGGPDEGMESFGSPRGVWLKRNDTFAITLWGSFSCPRVPASMERIADDAVTINFEASPQDPCTADLSPTTHEFTVPSGSTATPLTVTLTYTDGGGADSLTLD
jgi:hypothetical protein